MLDGDPAPFPKKGAQVGLGPGDIVLYPAPPPQKRAQPQVFGPCLLWPNDWMDQDRSWYGRGPWSRPRCARWGPSSPPQKGGGGRPRPRRLCVRWRPSFPRQKCTAPPIFGPCLFWPNGWMYQDATWYVCKPRPRRRCVRWVDAAQLLLNRYTAPSFRCMSILGKRLGWMQTPLGTKVDLGPRHIVLDGDPRKKGHSSSRFSSHVYCDHGRQSQLLLSSCCIKHIGRGIYS